MNDPSKPTVAQPPDSIVDPVLPDMAKILSAANSSGDGWTQDELTTRLANDGHVPAAIQWAIYIAKERRWLVGKFQQRNTRSENSRRGTVEAKSRAADVEVLVPTDEFFAAWRAGTLSVTISEAIVEGGGSTAPGNAAEVSRTGMEASDPRDDSGPELPGLLPPPRVICPLHGIWTLAAWQRGLADLASQHGWTCLLNRWWYGSYSPVAFLNPWSRERKFKWFRDQYDAEVHDKRHKLEDGRFPSVVAHSFGTYILGHALIRYDFIRFEKVILSGSILPVDFPWDKLIERGQVQAVRNEFGVRDPWVKRVSWFVRDTGPSGASGFTCTHPRLEQEKFAYDHSEYFGTDHMEDRWIPFLERELEMIPRSKSDLIELPHGKCPVGLYAIVGALSAVIPTIVVFAGTLAYKQFWSTDGDQTAGTSAEKPVSISYIEAIGKSDEAEAAGDWSHAKSELLNKYVRWNAFIDSTEQSGYVIQPRKEASKIAREKAAVALADRNDHPPRSPGKPVTATGRISRFDEKGITIVGATVTDGHTAESKPR